MVIENKNKYVLTNYKTVRKTGKTIDSDHKTEYLDLDLKIKHEKLIRKEISNFKDKKTQAEFKKITSITQDFINFFKKEPPVDKQIEMGRKVLKNIGVLLFIFVTLLCIVVYIRYIVVHCCVLLCIVVYCCVLFSLVPT